MNIIMCILLVDCGDPGRPVNGIVNFSNTTKESIANYSCNEGYTLVGATKRICQSNGSWSDIMPSCQS